MCIINIYSFFISFHSFYFCLRYFQTQPTCVCVLHGDKYPKFVNFWVRNDANLKTFLWSKARIYQRKKTFRQPGRSRGTGGGTGGRRIGSNNSLKCVERSLSPKTKLFSTTHVQLLQWLHGKQQQQHTEFWIVKIDNYI